MFHRGSVCFATVALIALSAPVLATQYDISTRADEIRADGLCSVREALLAINTQLGYIGDVPSDERGVTLSPGGEPRLTMAKQVRNISRGGSFVDAGSRLIASRGDVLEYRISVDAEQDAGDVTGVSLAFEFPHEDVTVLDSDTGTWRGYVSSYIADSTKLNGTDIDDVSGFPLAGPLLINDAKVGDETIVPGTIREGRGAEVVFRVRVEEGPDEAVSEDLPEEEAGGEDREYLVEAECPAGNLSNTINLKSVIKESGSAAVEYLLTQGTLEIGGSGGNVSVTFRPMSDGAFDDEEKQNVRIIASDNERVFQVSSSASLTLEGITLMGSGALPAGQNGGLIFSSGNLEFRGGTTLQDGLADQGGAVFIDGSRNLVFEQARFENNEATNGNGGAIATAPSFQGGISGDSFYFEGNTASGDGGALHFGGLARGLTLQNGTFYDNTAQDGAAVRIAAMGGESDLNNITIAGNTADAGGVALSYRTVVAGGGVLDTIANTVLLGNAGGDCAADDRPVADGPPAPGSDLTLDLAEIAYVVSAGAAPDAPSCGPLDAQFVANGGEMFDYSLVDFGLLVGQDGSDNAQACVAGVGPGSCLPQNFAGDLKGFLPNNDPAYSGAPAAGRIVPSVVSAGSPEDAVTYVCLDKDQRGLNREPRCDAGAVELQIAAGTNDEFRIVQGETVLLDVLANDLGDLVVDCRSLVDPLGCIGFFLPPRQSESVPVNWISGVISADNPAPPRTTVVVVEGREGVYLARDPVQKVAADGTPVVDENDLPVLEDTVTFPDGYPLVLHTSLPEFHGVDQFRYFVDRDAIAGPVYAGANPSANANLVVEPASGLTNREGTLSGAFGGAVVMIFVGLFLRFRRLSAALLCALAMTSQAADIVVNTTLDSANPQNGVFDRDGLCSLREALLVSIDRSPFFFPDCTSGATGRDRIIIDVDGTIELEATLDIFNSSVDIEGRGPGETIIQRATGAVEEYRVILASSSLTLKNLTIANGRSAENGGAIFTSANLTLDGVELRDNQASGSGGAIYLNFNAEQKRQFTARRSYIHGNTATGGNGGVLSMVGQNQQHDLFFDSVTFSNNTAPAGVGGALDVNLPRGGALRVLNSTFVGNSAGLGAALDLQQMDEATTAYIINSTFVDNSATAAIAGAGAIEAGDDSGRIYLSNSIYVGSGGCNTGAVTLIESYFNLFAAPAPASCEAPAPADVGNMETADADIRDVINDGILVGEQFSDGVYVPPHLPIVSEAREDLANYPAGEFIIDAGNGSLGLAANDSTPRACRALDLRGGSRESGGRCDVGAYELQVPTAIDDAVSNRTRPSRSIRFDVLLNDLAGDGVPDGTGIAENAILTGTIDLDPSTPGVVTPENIVSVDLDEGPDEDLRYFRISKVTNGSWSIDNSAEQLDEGVYELVAVLRDANDNFIASAQQTVIVRDPADAAEDDEFVVVSSSALRISGVNGDDDGDFIVSDGRLVVSGYTDADAGPDADPDAVPVVELFINDVSVGEADVIEGDPACGGDAGFEGEDQACIVYIEPQTPLSCEDVADDGLKVVFPYSFQVSNDLLAGPAVSTVANITATITNVAPRFEGETRRSVPGQVEVFRLVLDDPDLPSGLPLYDDNPSPAERKSRLKLVTAPKFARTVIRELNIDGPEVLELVYGIEDYGVIDPDSEAFAPGTDGLGLLVREEAPGVIDVIYTPRNNDGQFNDSFVLSYEDECGATANAQFRIIYPEANNLAGSFGWYGLVGVLALFIRRRARF